ncbi:MAG: phosphoribosyltransferase [Planctomycetota bacterium]
MFDDRSDAGRKLARALEKYKNKNAVVLAIPRGGVEVGYHVAKHLNADLSLIVARKLPFPDNPESGFGAVAEDGSAFLYRRMDWRMPEEVVERIKRDQQKEVQRRIAVLRGGRPLPDLKGRTVILVDDGIAMGSTMRASILLCKNKGAGKIVVAAPVSGDIVAKEIAEDVDDVVILETPRFFRAVAQVYRNWYDVPDDEVIAILEKWRAEHTGDSRG